MTTTRVAHVLHLPDGLTLDSPEVEYIGRQNNRYQLRRSKWANQFTIGPHGDRAEVIAKHRAAFVALCERFLVFVEELHALKGKVLACWCKWPNPATPCHGDTYVELINLWWPEEEEERQT